MSLGHSFTDGTSAENLLDLLRVFMEAGRVDGFDREARMILETVLRCDYTSIRAGLAAAPTMEQVEEAFKFASKRVAGAPIAHVLGFAHFYGRIFKLAPGVLVPRPETEILVDVSIELLNTHRRRQPEILDLYTGCGNVLLSIAAGRKIGRGIGIDSDQVALDFAIKNLQAFDLENIEFRCGDVAEALERLDQRFHLVTANPPYVKTGDIPGLQPEISLHESRPALDGGPDGLDQIRMLADKASRVISPGGFLVCEIGKNQDISIPNIFKSWSDIEFRQDLNGVPRILLARP